MMRVRLWVVDFGQVWLMQADVAVGEDRMFAIWMLFLGDGVASSWLRHCTAWWADAGLPETQLRMFASWPNPLKKHSLDAAMNRSKVGHEACLHCFQQLRSLHPEVSATASIVAMSNGSSPPQPRSSEALLWACGDEKCRILRVCHQGLRLTLAGARCGVSALR